MTTPKLTIEFGEQPFQTRVLVDGEPVSGITAFLSSVSPEQFHASIVFDPFGVDLVPAAMKKKLANIPGLTTVPSFK